MFNNRMEEWINACPRVKFISWALSAFSSPNYLDVTPFFAIQTGLPAGIQVRGIFWPHKLHRGHPLFGVGAGVALFLHHLPWGEASGEPSIGICGDQDQVRHQRQYKPQRWDVHISAGRRTHRLTLGDLTSPSAVGSWTTAWTFPAICLRLCNHRDLGSHPCCFIY